METITSILSGKGRPFNIVSPDCPLYTALHQMSCEGVDYLIVMEEDQFLGIITKHDVASKIAGARLNMDTATVKDFICSMVFVVSEDDSVVYAMQLMDIHDVRHLAVYDNLQFRGVISAMDILKQTLRNRNTLLEEESVEHAYPWNY